MEAARPEKHFALGVAITAQRKDDIVLLRAASRVCARPDLPVLVTDDLAGIYLYGDGERDLEMFVSALQQHVSFGVAVGPLEVQYREMLVRAVTIDQVHKKADSGTGEFAAVTIAFEPGEAGSGALFENRTTNETLPRAFVLAVARTLAEERDRGVVAGFPIIDFKAALLSGKYHELDSNERVFGIAAREAFHALAGTGGVTIVEPVLYVEVATPEEFLGGVIGDLNSRRGQITGTDTRGGLQVVTALVPAGNLFGYFNVLMTMTNGRATCTAAFDHYQTVPLMPDHDPKEPMAAVGTRRAA